MNKIGVYYAYWARDWDVDFHPFIDKAAQLGFDVLEVNAGTVAALSSEQRRALKSHAAERDLGLTYCIGLPPKYDVAAESSTTRAAGVRYLQRMAAAIGEMGGGTLGGILYGAWPGALPAGADRRRYLERSLASMREAIKAAEDHGVQFCFEVVNRFEQFIINTAAEGVAYLQALDSPNARLMLDTFHINIEEHSPRAAVEAAGDYLGHLHLGERNRKPPGTGTFPWQELAAALRDVDYRGALVMEPFVKPGGKVGEDIRVYRDLSGGEDLDRAAARSLAFLRQLVEQPDA